MVSDIEVAQGVIQVIDGLFPETDEVSSAELSSDNLPAVLTLLQQHIDGVKAEIRHVGESQQDEVVAWTQEARKLHSELSQDKDTLAEITEYESRGNKLDDRVEDLTSQQNLLSDELIFNRDLVALLTAIKDLQDIVAEAESYAEAGSLSRACGRFEDASHALEDLDNLSASNQVLAVGLIRENIRSLREGLIETVEDCWIKLISADSAEKSLSINKDVPFTSGTVNGGDIVDALDKLGVLKERLDRLHHKITTILIFPRLDLETGANYTFAVNSDHTKLQLKRQKQSNKTVTSLYNDLRVLFDFLSERLGPSISHLLSKTLTPAILHQLMGSNLPECIPAEIERLGELETVLKETTAFEEYLDQSSWLEGNRGELKDWVSRAPRIWLSRRREYAMDSLRKAFADGLGQRHRVERVERVKEVDGVLEEAPKPIDEGEDHWDTNWDVDMDEVEEEKKPAQEPPKPISTQTKAPVKAPTDEDEDVSGWGFDDDDIDIDGDDGVDTKGDSSSEVKATTQKEDGDDNMDWGWGDEDDSSKKNTAETKKVNGNSQGKESKDVTLTETYSITSIPQEVIDIILRTIGEADKLSQPEYASFATSTSTSGLLNIPTSVLTAYRALAPIFYMDDPSPAICIYNDCEWLEEHLVKLEKDVKAKGAAFGGFDLQPSIKAIALFGRRAYWRDMDGKRIILSDLLDGAQGFENCTQYPRSTNCETAVSSVIQAIQGIAMQWEDTLSRSALLQSIGSLLNSVIVKFINDIEDLGDISADASAVLAGYITEISKLESLFIHPDQPKDALPMTPVYCEKWLKFQYLGNILDCTMAEIMDLWRDGALIDFEKDELIDLVKALFADGEKRSKVIEELRRG